MWYFLPKSTDSLMTPSHINGYPICRQSTGDVLNGEQYMTSQIPYFLMRRCVIPPMMSYVNPEAWKEEVRPICGATLSLFHNNRNYDNYMLK